MTRLELLAAAGVLIFVCACSLAGPGYEDLSVAEASAEGSLVGLLAPLQRYSFHVAAIAVTLLGLLLEDGRRRSLRSLGSASPSRRP
jgi:hypothetical protein